MAIVGNLMTILGLDASGFKSGLKEAENKANSFDKKLKSNVQSVMKYSAAITGIGLASYFTSKKMVEMFAEMTAVQRSMKFATGSAEEAAKAWSFVREEGARLHLGIGTLAEGYARFANAAKSTKLATEDVQSIFTAVTEKVRILGLSTDRTERVFDSLQQMMSLNVITMQTLKIRLAKHLPGAMAVMAKSLNVTRQELADMIKTGKLLAEDVLPLMANQMRVDQVNAIKEMGEVTTVTLGDLETAWSDFKGSFQGTVVEDSVRKSMAAWIESIKTATLWVGKLDAMWKRFNNVTEESKADLFGKVVEDAKEAEVAIEQVGFAAEEIAERQNAIFEKLAANSEAAIKAWKDNAVNTFQSVTGEFVTFISDMATGADVSFGDMLNNMAKHLLDFSTEMIVVKPILEWFKTWLEDVTKPGTSQAGGFLSSILGMFGFSSLAAPATATTAYAGGGIINEPVVGIGAKSHSSYLLGEAGPEAVVPTDELGGGGGKTANVSVNITAMDSKSVTDLLKNNPQAITGPIVDALSSGDRGLSSSIRMAVI